MSDYQVCFGKRTPSAGSIPGKHCLHEQDEGDPVCCMCNESVAHPGLDQLKAALREMLGK